MGTVYAEITLRNMLERIALNGGKANEGNHNEQEVRSITVNAVVDTAAETVLLGAIALEGMDLMVDPVNLDLVGVHGDHEEYLAL